MADIFYSYLDLTTGKQLLSDIHQHYSDSAFANEFTVYSSTIVATMKKNYRLSQKGEETFDIAVSSQYYMNSTLLHSLDKYKENEVPAIDEADYEENNYPKL